MGSAFDRKPYSAKKIPNHQHATTGNPAKAYFPKRRK